MADIRCPVCGEPWDTDCLHEEVSDRFPHKPWYVENKPEKDVYAHQETNASKATYGRWYSQEEYSKYFQAIRKEFTIKGCLALRSYTGSHNLDTINKKNSIYGELMEFAGDDIDFATSMIEDAERYGLLD